MIALLIPFSAFRLNRTHHRMLLLITLYLVQGCGSHSSGSTRVMMNNMSGERVPIPLDQQTDAVKRMTGRMKDPDAPLAIYSLEVGYPGGGVGYQIAGRNYQCQDGRGATIWLIEWFSPPVGGRRSRI